MATKTTIDDKLHEAFLTSSSGDGGITQFEYVYMTANGSLATDNSNALNVEMLYRAKYYSPRVEGMLPAGFCKFNPVTACFEREPQRANFSPSVFTTISDQDALRKAASLVARFGPKPPKR